MFRVAQPIKGLSKLAKLEVEAFSWIHVPHLLHYRKKKSVPRSSLWKEDKRGTLCGE